MKKYLHSIKKYYPFIQILVTLNMYYILLGIENKL